MNSQVYFLHPKENSPVDILHPLTTIRPVEVRVRRLDLASLNSTINLTDEDEASVHVPADAVQDNSMLKFFSISMELQVINSMFLFILKF